MAASSPIHCRNCGVTIRRVLRRWVHTARLGPVACPKAEPEPPEPGTDEPSSRRPQA
jgi:hypothetical protein